MRAGVVLCYAKRQFQRGARRLGRDHCIDKATRGCVLRIQLHVVSLTHLVHLSHRSEEHTSELQSQFHLVCRLLLEKKKKNKNIQDNKQNKNIITSSIYLRVHKNIPAYNKQIMTIFMCGCA